MYIGMCVCVRACVGFCSRFIKKLLKVYEHTAAQQMIMAQQLLKSSYATASRFISPKS